MNGSQYPPSDDQVQSQAVPVPTHSSQLESGVLVAAIAVALLVLWSLALLLLAWFGLLSGGRVATRLLSPEAVVTGAMVKQVEQMFARDYPDWELISTHVEPYDDQGHQIADYVVKAIPPNRAYSLGIVYTCTDQGPPVSQDEVLRPAGTWHVWSDPLYDYLERHYVEQGRTLDTVTSDTGGSVTVEWSQESGRGLTLRRNSAFDGLWFDEITNEWLD